jgi:hypothetical protein
LAQAQLSRLWLAPKQPMQQVPEPKSLALQLAQWLAWQ